jgi:hypothetical protein
LKSGSVPTLHLLPESVPIVNVGAKTENGEKNRIVKVPCPEKQSTSPARDIYSVFQKKETTKVLKFGPQAVKTDKELKHVAKKTCQRPREVLRQTNQQRSAEKSPPDIYSIFQKKDETESRLRNALEVVVVSNRPNPNLSKRPSPNLSNRPNPNLSKRPSPNLSNRPNPNLSKLVYQDSEDEEETISGEPKPKFAKLYYQGLQRSEDYKRE